MRGPSRKFIKNLEAMSMDKKLSPAERIMVANLLRDFYTSAVPHRQVQTLNDLRKELTKEDELASLLKETYEPE